MDSPRKQPLGQESDVCDVCGLSLAGLAMLAHPYLGKTYHFCTSKCLQEYLTDPEKYARFADEEEDE